MKISLTPARNFLFALLIIFASFIATNAQTSAFTYQGRFTSSSVPANGTYTMKFRLYGSLDQNDQIGAEQTILVTATNGIFAVELDFGAASFPAGANRWLEVQIGATTLAPRQRLNASPFAIRSLDANKADGLSTICNPCVTDSQIVGISGSKVTGSVTSADNAASATNALNLGGVAANNYLLKSGGTITGNLAVGGVISGDGSGLTNLPSGGSGTSWQVFSGTTLQAQSNKAYITNNPAQVSITLPPAPNVGDVIRISATGAGGFKLLQNAGQVIVRQRSYQPFTVWTPHEINRQWSAVASSDNGSKLVATANNGLIYTSNDYGVTWTPSPNTVGQWSAVASSADGTKLVAAENQGRIWTSTDSGATWTPRDSTSRQWRSVASSTDGTKLAAVVYDGQIYTSTDSGVTWTPRETNRKWTTIASSADGTKLAAGADLLSPIYTSTDSGATWSPNSGFTWMISIASSYDGTKLLSAGSKGYNLYTSTDSGQNWVTRDSARNWQRVSSSADGTILAATAIAASGSGGDRVYVSTNSGVTWAPRDIQRAWGAVAVSADARRMIAVVPGGQIYTATYSSPYTTQPGTLGYLEIKDVAAIELQYVGNGEFVWLSHEGDILAF